MRKSFTLIELLVVVAIIAVLVAILLPALQSARDSAKVTVCLSNVRQIATAISSYTVNENDYYPVPPLGVYFHAGYDIGKVYPSQLYGGDDIGGWPVTPLMPGDVRPLAKYLDPYSPVYRDPGDDHPYPWAYGQAQWDYMSTSYAYNASGQVGTTVPGLFGARSSQIEMPSLTIAIGDSPWWAIRSDLAADNIEMVTTNPDVWFHQGGFENRKVNLGFADGHAAYTAIQIMVQNTATYRLDR